MIIDTIKNFNAYENLHPQFYKVSGFISSLDIKNLRAGKFDIDGDNLFALISDTAMRERDDAKLEVHNNYIDVQIPISRSEGFGWKDRAMLGSPLSDFDKAKDIQFFDDTPDLFFELSPQNFVIFFPHDAHSPCIGCDSVFKIVIKIKVK